MTHAFRLHVAPVTRDHGSRVVLWLRGELDISNRNMLRQVLDDILERDPQVVEVDLSGVGFADCGTLSVLISAHARLAGRGGELILKGDQPMVRRLLVITGLDTFFKFGGPGQQEDDRQ